MKVSVKDVESCDERYFNDSYEKVKPTIEQNDVEEITHQIDDSIPPELVEGNIIGDEKNRAKRKELLSSIGVEPVDFAYERAIGKNDSVYSNFVDLITEAKKKVGRIIVKEDGEVVGYATGFMVSEELLLTNWHVFKTEESVGDSIIQFDYELDINGNPKNGISYQLSTTIFYGSDKSLDYCLVGVESNDLTNNHHLSEIGFLLLNPIVGKLGDQGVERLNLIHHPNGDFKQLSIRENKFDRILPTSIWYKSDTSQGSSGSPVFNDQFQVVALHHMGVADKDEHGNYIDKDKNIIPVVDNKIDISKVHWIANEGIRISVIRRHLPTKFPEHPLIQKLLGNSLGQRFIFSKSNLRKTPSLSKPSPSSEQKSQTIQNPIESPSSKPQTMENSINISIPSHLLENQKNINVNITTNDILSNQNSNGLQNQTFVAPNGVSSDSMIEQLIEEESLRLERSMDYSACDGYQSDFLGDDFRVAIPKPLASIKPEIATMTDSNSYILKYYKFSVIFNAFKKMSLISGINIDGDEDKRQDFTKRRDVWIRDNRIDLDVQLDNKYYKKSGFDRGHMSRREDANWGKNAFEAKRNADLTCMHTNACPQVPALNRSNRSGLWGRLEKIVLEQGAIKEDGKTGKISVFSGPIFKDSDPMYKGVKVPLEFYKVILWISDENKLKATAFKLSQRDLVADIDFEDIGIDRNFDFLHLQCSLKSLQEETQINFEKLFEFDTFVGDEETIEIENDCHLMEMLRN